MENDKKQLNLDIKPEIVRGTYSNLAIISHSHSEFVLDFAAILPGMQKPDIGSRILMTPEHAKRLLNALVDNISKYESMFGEIEMPGQSQGQTFNLADFKPSGTKS